MDLRVFTKVDIAHTSKKSYGKYIRIYRESKTFIISDELMRELNWKPNDRVDLYKLGKTFLIKKESAGCLMLKKYSTSEDNRTACIRREPFRLEVFPVITTDTPYFWVEDGCLLFENADMGGN